MERRQFPTLLLFILIITISTLQTPTTTSAAADDDYSPDNPPKCNSLIDYVSTENATTTFASIQAVYTIRDIRLLFGANNLPLTTPPNQTIPPKQRIKIPFPCRNRGTYGVSDRIPIYTVKKGDVLDDVAANVFGGVLTAEDIVSVNNVAGKELIEVGERLWVPLPCRCGNVDGTKVVHYGHLVENGSTIDGIAAKFGSSVEVLMGVNGLQNGSVLLPGQVLDVPLKACSSSIRPDSEDSQMLLANGTYTFTANDCVQCNCDVLNNLTIQCQPSGVKPSNWSTCPSMQCRGDNHNGIMLGNSSSTSDCDSATCSYTGFSSNHIIFTSLDDTCPSSPSAAPSAAPSSGNSGGRRMTGSKWWNLGLFWLVHLMILQLRICLR